MYQLATLPSAVVWLSWGQLSWGLVGFYMICFQGLKRKFKTQPFALGTLTQAK